MQVVLREKGVDGADPHSGLYPESKFPSENDTLSGKFAQPPATASPLHLHQFLHRCHVVIQVPHDP
jgi:hypothetical protein